MTMVGDTSSNPAGSVGKSTGNGVKASTSGQSGVLIVQDDTVINGRILNCRTLEVHGMVEGEVEADKLIVHEDGKVHGTVKVDSADVDGMLQGRVYVRNLIHIRSAGTVIGNVQYGQLAMESGANLSAEVRNVPPTLSGDFNLSVVKGKSAPVTTWDITAFDPDDDAKDLVFVVSRPVGGFVALKSNPTRATDRFTQEDLENGRVLFQHYGKDMKDASFAVVVNDAKGGTSGAAETVTVSIKAP